jgi:CheY-like chemotaxis protein
MQPSSLQTEEPPVPRVLVVDDEPPVAELLQIILECHGYSVTIASSGEKALAQFHEHPWALVVTDRLMPGMSGEQLAKAVRELDRGTPLVLMTGEMSGLEDTTAFQAILPKPFSPDQLTELVDRLSRRPEVVSAA